MRARNSVIWATTLALFGIASNSPSQSLDAAEASGIVRVDNELLIVSDRDPGGYYRFPLAAAAKVVSIDPAKLTRVNWTEQGLALDLESIEILADGRVVILSERLRSLIGEKGVVMEYDDPLGEIGERGLEGVAVRSLSEGGSRVAVLWEGGYPSTLDMAAQLIPIVAGKALRPTVVTHDLAKDARLQRHRMDKAAPGDIIELQVPQPEGSEPAAQRFRAPDLVWHLIADNEWGFIVLLNSSSAEPERYEHLWLQRFGLDGRPIGPHVDIDRLVPENLRALNWEGLSWFEPDRSLILIDDVGGKRTKGSPNTAIIPLPDSWRSAKVKASRDSAPSTVASNAAGWPSDAATTEVVTPIPDLLADWRVRATSPTASEKESRADAEQQRPRVEALKDPFTPLAKLNCAERGARKPPERVVWEDDDTVTGVGLMALVDFGNSGAALLVTPKTHFTFPMDVPPHQLPRLNRVAAAVCDGLVEAAGGKPSATKPVCQMWVNPPVAVSLSQLHVHVEANTSPGVAIDDAFLQRAAAHIRSRLGGKGCF